MGTKVTVPPSISEPRRGLLIKLRIEACYISTQDWTGQLFLMCTLTMCQLLSLALQCRHTGMLPSSLGKKRCSTQSGPGHRAAECTQSITKRIKLQSLLLCQTFSRTKDFGQATSGSLGNLQTMIQGLLFKVAIRNDPQTNNGQRRGPAYCPNADDQTALVS